MSPQPRQPVNTAPDIDNPAAVDAFLDACPHPLLPALRALRQLLLDAIEGVTEGIKWNAPSFHCGEWFATFHLRKPSEVQVVFHRGVKKRPPPGAPYVDDPTGLLNWKADDRGVATFSSLSEVELKAEPFGKLTHAWVTRLRAELVRD